MTRISWNLLRRIILSNLNNIEGLILNVEALEKTVSNIEGQEDVKNKLEEQVFAIKKSIINLIGENESLQELLMS